MKIRLKVASCYDRFMEKLVAKVKGLKIGDPMKEDTQLGAIVSREQMEKALSYIEIGKKGEPPSCAGGCAPPTRPSPRGSLSHRWFSATSGTRCGSRRRRSSAPSSPPRLRSST
jgi:acyl-CoA reductase-like NAD-dependent aldehyde dehydrogenase